MLGADRVDPAVDKDYVFSRLGSGQGQSCIKI